MSGKGSEELSHLPRKRVARADAAVRVLGARNHVAAARDGHAFVVKPGDPIGRWRVAVFFAAGDCVALDVALGVVVRNSKEMSGKLLRDLRQAQWMRMAICAVLVNGRTGM